jgi:hypothetical protein
MDMKIGDVANSLKEHPSVWLLSVTFVAGFIYLKFWSSWNGIAFIKVDATNIVGYLTPLLLTAALIERAVEVVITPWRDPEADDKAIKVATAAAQVKAGDANAQNALNTNAGDLNQYKGKTRQYAYAIAVALSVLAVTAGVRTLWPLLDTSKAVPTDQLNFFRWYDMVLTTLLLAGGAAGLHAPINAFTSFFEKKS